MPNCPAGHSSVASDYCDICGTPLPAPDQTDVGGPSGWGQAADPQPAGMVSRECPHCAAAYAPGALFCQACGYDFTTGTLPRAGLWDLGPPPDLAGSDPGLSAPVPPTPAAPTPAPNVSPPSFGWIAEIWIDPEWYTLQQSTDPLPAPGLPRIVALGHRSMLIGRTSRSRNIKPDIDCEPDTGISRRHAQLTTDGTRWWVEDLNSVNGSFVAPTGAPLPQDPLPAGQRRELAGDDLLFVGAWTRIVIRPADPGEIESLS